jgi:hypothetical protein
MKWGFAVAFLLVLGTAQASQANPIEKVLQMISDLQQNMLKEADEAHKAYVEYAEFCEDRAQKVGFEIKTGKGMVAELQATIESKTATITSLTSKIEEISADISSDEADLKAATVIRKKEAADFAAEEKELKEVTDSLERAISIVTKEAAKSGASMLQMKNANNVAQAFAVMVQAAAMSSDDATKLTALVQERQNSENDDSHADLETGAPAAAAYENNSGIVDTLQGLLDKATAQLDKARDTETKALQNYEMLKQSLSDEMKVATKDMAEAKTNLAESQEAKSVAEGDLEATSKDLKGDLGAKRSLHHDCMTAAQEYQAATTSRGEELKALAEAKKVIQETTGGAAGQTYGLNQMSFLQMSSRAKLRSGSDLAKFEAVRYVRSLAARYKNMALAQLASRMNSALRLGSASGQDPFAKVKGLITDMLSQLESEAEDEASEKAYCDKEMSESAAKKDDTSTEVESLSTKIKQKSAASAKLKEEVATLQNELAGITSSMAKATQLRQEEKATFEKNKPVMEQGLRGVKVALKVLKEYYAKDDQSHDSGSGAGAGIIGLLEVVESDFTKGIAELVAEEDSSVYEYEEMMKSTSVEKATKEQDATFKTKEYKSLDKAVSELSTDLSGTQDELNAILEYDAKIKERCIAKPEPYEERKKRREAELAGLKQALTILDGESFLQRSSKHTLRGAARHHA